MRSDGKPYLVATAMHIQVRRKRNTAAKEEDGIQSVGEDHEDRRYGKPLIYSCDYQVDERQHCKYGDEHAVIYYGRIAGVGFGNHVADKSHDEERAEELCTGEWGQ